MYSLQSINLFPCSRLVYQVDVLNSSNCDFAKALAGPNILNFCVNSGHSTLLKIEYFGCIIDSHVRNTPATLPNFLYLIFVKKIF